MTKTTLIGYGLAFALLCVFLILGRRKPVYKRCDLCLKYHDGDGNKINGLDLPERERCYPVVETCEECSRHWGEKL